MLRRLRIALLAGALACGPALAQPPSYVLMSLVGHELTVVTAVSVAGSRLDRNRYDRVPIENRAFDVAALKAADDVLRERRPQAKVTMLAGADRAWAGAARLGLHPGSKEFNALIEGIASISERAGYDRLILVLPAEGDLRFVGSDGSRRGSGRAAGIGIYVDRSEAPRRDEIAATRGFLGLFSNIRIAIVDVKSRALLAHEATTSGVAVSAERSPDADPANALSGAEKTQALEGLLRREIERVLPELLSRIGT